jgi:hypothetical protein
MPQPIFYHGGPMAKPTLYHEGPMAQPIVYHGGLMVQPILYHGGLLTQPIFHQNDGLYHGVMGGTCGSRGDTALARPRPTIHLDTNWVHRFKESKHSPAIQRWASTCEQMV